MIRSNFPSFLVTQNQRDLYDAFDSSYTPTTIFSLRIRMTSLYIPGGIGMFLWAHGMCSIVGMTIRSKYASLRQPFSVSSHANASSCSLTTQCANFFLPAKENPLDSPLAPRTVPGCTSSQE